MTAGLTDRAMVSATTTVDRVAVARAVAAAVTGLPGVARLSAGSVVESATHHAGGKIVGVTVGHQAVTVCLVAASLPLPALIDRTRAAVAGALAGLGATRRVDIVIDDVEIARLPGHAAPELVTDHPGTSAATRPTASVQPPGAGEGVGS